MIFLLILLTIFLSILLCILEFWCIGIFIYLFLSFLSFSPNCFHLTCWELGLRVAFGDFFPMECCSYVCNWTSTGMIWFLVAGPTPLPQAHGFVYICRLGCTSTEVILWLPSLQSKAALTRLTQSTETFAYQQGCLSLPASGQGPSISVLHHSVFCSISCSRDVSSCLGAQLYYYDALFLYISISIICCKFGAKSVKLWTPFHSKFT